MRTLLSAMMVFVLGLGASALNAAEEKPKKKPTPEEQFKKLDKNKDEKVSKEEFIGKREGEKKEKAEKAFTAKDKDKDGKLSLEEFKAKPKKKKGE